ncbi:MAG: hypothetical protein KDC84_03910 [Crocinitomicaceae bacterium]|nr:hypothetical protein [Crocinitomicaceae bacterium]
MKKFATLIVVASIGFFTACGGEEDMPKKEGGEEQVDLDGFEELPMKEYDLNISLMLPTKETAVGTVKPQVDHEDGGFKWVVSVGPTFGFTIEDFGSEGNLIQRHKERLAEKEFFHVEYVQEEGNVILYKRLLKYDGKVEDTEKKNVYFVFGEFQIGNVNYNIKSTEEGLFKPEAEELMNTIKSIKVNE